MFTSAAIDVYTDGSFTRTATVPAADSTRLAYGWVCGDAPQGFAKARAVVVPRKELPAKHWGANHSQRMEAAGIVDAIAEFAPLGRKIRIFTDCQSMANQIARYQAGELPKDYFMQAEKLLLFKDAVRLTRFLAELPVEVIWVKGHSGCFENTVVDRMLRDANLKGMAEAQAVKKAIRSIEAGVLIAA